MNGRRAWLATLITALVLSVAALLVKTYSTLSFDHQFGLICVFIGAWLSVFIPLMIVPFVRKSDIRLNVEAVGSTLVVTILSTSSDLAVQRVTLTWKQKMESKLKQVQVNLLPPPGWGGIAERNHSVQFLFKISTSFGAGVLGRRSELVIMEEQYEAYSASGDHLGRWSSSTILSNICDTLRSNPCVSLFSAESMKPVAAVKPAQLMPLMQELRSGVNSQKRHDEDDDQRSMFDRPGVWS